MPGRYSVGQARRPLGSIVGVDVFLETERLVLRRLTPDDVDRLVELDSDPEVMRFLTGGKPTPREVIDNEVLPRLLGLYERFGGMGVWAAIEKSTGEFIGGFALHPVDGRDADDVELGYRLRRSAWGRGYATEGSRALIRKAFTELGARRVWAQTMAVNLASRRVMEKAGLRYERTFHEHFDDPIEGTEHGEVEYALLRADWARGSDAGSEAGSESGSMSGAGKKS
jgi:RimJ/RimL family protein N-acetyltransferase